MPVQARRTPTTGAISVGNVLEIQQHLKERTAELRLARDELQQTTSELMLTTLELDERVEQRTRELQQAREELQRTNSELLLLTMELEERVERRTQELADSNTALNREIAVRRQTEARLRQSQKILSNAERLAHIGAWSYLPDRDIFRPSDEWRQIHGTRDSTLGLDTMLAYTHPDERALLAAHFERLVRYGVVFEYRYRIIREASGQLRYVATYAQAEMPRGKSTIEICGACHDITESVLSEAALRESELRHRTIVETAQEGIWLIDATGRTAFANAKMCQMLGYTSDEITGTALLDFVEQDWKTIVRDTFRRLREGVATQCDLKLRRKGGSPLWALVSATASHLGDSMRDGALAMVTDISERKQVENDLRIAAAAFETQEGMIITDPASVILRVNQAFTRITGYRSDEVVGRTPRILSSGRQDAAFYVSMWQQITETGSWQGELWNRRKGGEFYPEWLTITAVVGEGGAVTNYVGTLVDVTHHKQAEDQIAHLAYYDSLTELPNRRLLLDRLSVMRALSDRTYHHGALLFIDLDNFKMLNDTRGHDKGDLLLQQVAQRLMAAVRASDIVARFGGDEFVVILSNLSRMVPSAATEAQNAALKISDVLSKPYALAGIDYSLTASIGLSLFKGTSPSAEDLLKQADLAMYQAKTAGRNGIRFFNPEMQSSLEARATLEAELRAGLKTDQFVLYYQPQVDSTGAMRGVEALLRWQHPGRGLVGPASFISLCEESGLIQPLGDWVLTTACGQLAAWATTRITADLKMAVNVSVRQFRHPSFVDKVLSVVEKTGADAGKLVLEITESLLVDDVADAIGKMSRLKSHGVKFSLDDFGTGYSSLSYLKQLPLDELKIAQSFVRDLLSDPDDAAIAQMVLSLGKTLGLTVVAEGVESSAQRDFLSRHGCTLFQGFLFGHPCPAEQLFARDEAIAGH